MIQKAGMQSMPGSAESSYSSELKDKIYPFGQFSQASSTPRTIPLKRELLTADMGDLT